VKNDNSGTKRKVVNFNPENYPEVLSALRKLKENLVESDLDRASGKLIVVVTKGTSLDPFQAFQIGQGEKMDKRLKVKVTPMGPANAGVLRQIHGIVISDLAKQIRRVIFKNGEYMTILFVIKEEKDKFIALVKSKFIAEVVLKS